MPKLDAQKHASVSFCILIALLFVFYSIIIHPAVLGRLHFLQRYDELQFQFSKLNNVQDKTSALRQELAKLGRQDIDKTGFLENKPEALVAADLQQRIKELIESSGAELISTQVVQQKETDVFPRVTVKVHLRGRIEALRTILYRLDIDQPVLVINNLFVQKRQSARARRGADQLEVRFDISGFIYKNDAS